MMSVFKEINELWALTQSNVLSLRVGVKQFRTQISEASSGKMFSEGTTTYFHGHWQVLLTG